MPFANNGNPSPKTIKIERHLVDVHEVGKVVSYTELEVVAGEPIRVGTRGFGYLTTARRRILSSHRIHTITIVGVGIKFPTPEEHLADAANQRRFIGRKSRRARNAAESLDMEHLTPTERAYHLAHVGQFASIQYIGSSQGHTRLQSRLPPGERLLPDVKTLLEHLK